MTVGTELAQARQQRGLSLDDISARTKISVERLAAIEQMDGEHLPTVLYLKGFLRAYAIEVGLDPDDVTSRYLTEIEPAAAVELSPIAAPVSSPYQEEAPQPMNRGYGALFLVPIIALIAGVLFAANVDKFRGRSISEPAPAVTTPAKSDDASKATDVRKAADERESEVAPAPDAVPADVPEKTSMPDVSGTWTVTNRVESANYGAFKGLALGFRLQLQQRGNQGTGAGAKISENGSALPPGRRTPITVEGTLDGRRLQLTFTERGAQRSSTGNLSLELTDEGSLHGTFASEAANARGTVSGVRYQGSGIR